MKYLEGLIEWESNGLKGIPTNLLQEYIVDLQCELENRKKAFEGESNQNMNKIQDLALPKTAVISRLFSELATKHNVKVDDLNLHISCKTLYIQKYTPNSKNEYECLEMVDLNGL
jgi:hypothetical protein